LVADRRRGTEEPWLAFTGFFTVAILLTLLIFIGEAVRDALDPRKTFT
ncbi:MAG TPA: ABC transporter permease, partial [Xanthobacteraceae bacterium]|nr:ABC transporter permease [Xanthobacteraceae bacterium]